MKVYSIPSELAYADPDYSNYNTDIELAREEQHIAQLKEFLISAGYTGKHTGKIVTFPVADSRAAYMLADGKRSYLIHLPYGDALHFREVEFLPKVEILRRIDSSEKLRALFRKQSVA